MFSHERRGGGREEAGGGRPREKPKGIAPLLSLLATK
jgi:hypothetical protein